MTVKVADTSAGRWMPAGSSFFGAPQGPVTWTLRNESNTGITGVGMTEDDLTPSGSITVNDDDMVFEDLLINGAVTVNADRGPTFRRCKIIGPDGNYYPIRNNGSSQSRMTIEDSEITSLFVNAIAAVSWGRYNIRRCNIHGVEDGLNLDVGEATVEDNYLHDLERGGSAPHCDILHCGSGANIVVRRNSMVMLPQQTSLGIFKASGGPIDNVLIEANYCDGGGYCFYFRRSDDGANRVTNATVRNNVFTGRHETGKGLCNIDDPITWTGNKYLDGSTAGRADRPSSDEVTIVGGGAPLILRSDER